MIAARVATVVGVVGVGVLLSCGGGTPPECPTGNCTLPGEVIVKWQFDAYPQLLFPMDSCVDFMVDKVEVDAIDGGGLVTTQNVDCGAAQATFETLAPGDYTINVTPLDANGNAVVALPIAGMVTAGGPGSQMSVTINVPYTAWIGTYTGTFLFRLTWGGVTCSAATPIAVTKQVLTLMSGGVAVSALTDTGQRLDGTDPEACRELTENFPQTVLNVPFGPATLIVIGKDNSDVVLFQHSFDTFVGAGISNPTITYNVPGPDAGLDAPSD